MTGNAPIVWDKVALLAEGVDRNRLHYICTMEDETSPSSQRAWIEIGRACMPYLSAVCGSESPSSQRAWIEMARRRNRSRRKQSPSSQRAWIEIGKGCTRRHEIPVALLAEGVDRNMNKTTRCMPVYVALLAEGVDRNTDLGADVDNAQKSPSSQRAWIEIGNRSG